MLSKYHWVML